MYVATMIICIYDIILMHVTQYDLTDCDVTDVIIVYQPNFTNKIILTLKTLSMILSTISSTSDLCHS